MRLFQIIIVVLLLVCVYGMYYLANKSPIVTEVANSPEEVILNEVELTGVVTSVNLNEVAFDGPALVTVKTDSNELHTIAVPSMGMAMCAANLNIASTQEVMVGDMVKVSGSKMEIGQIVPCDKDTHYLTIDRIYSSKENDFSFIYRISPNGYTLTTDTSLQSNDSDYQFGVQLMSDEDVASLASRVGGEGPPTINIRVYDNATNITPADWIEAKSAESNIQLVFSDPIEFVLAGKKGLRYVSDGLYPTDTVVVTHGSMLYVITGSYIEPESEIRNTYLQLLETFRFVSETDGVN